MKAARRLLAVRLLGLALWLAIGSLLPTCGEDHHRDVDTTPPPLRIEVAFPRIQFHRPVVLACPPGRNERLYVGEQGGKVFRFDNRADVAEKEVFLDLSAKTLRSEEEEGFLGLAFHPRFEENGFFYVHYSVKESEERRGGPHDSRISRFHVDPEGRAEAGSETILLEVHQPYWNHNGGCLAFGPDGYLYIGIGDGGSQGDPHGNGQRLDTLLGKVLRIDVDRAERGRPYGIPPDNPFVGRGKARPEIWCYGMRNPWRFAFDRKTGALWCGDVGWSDLEEIDVLRKGGNYGWVYMEGTRRTGEGGKTVPSDLIPPVWEYDHSDGRASITGGCVYRGKGAPSLEGAYVYADYASGDVWALWFDGKKVTRNAEIAYGTEIDHALYVSSFGEDAEGEVYLLAFDGYVYRFVEE